MKIKWYGIPGMVLVLIIRFFGFIVASAVSLTAESKQTKYIETHNHLMGRFGPPGRQILDYEGAAQHIGIPLRGGFFIFFLKFFKKYVTYFSLKKIIDE